MLKLMCILVYVNLVLAFKPINPVPNNNINNLPDYKIPAWVYKQVFSQNINKYQIKKKEEPKVVFKIEKNDSEEEFLNSGEVSWDDITY